MLTLRKPWTFFRFGEQFVVQTLRTFDWKRSDAIPISYGTHLKFIEFARLIL